MSLLEVSELRWYSYVRLAADSSFTTLMKGVMDPYCGFFKGLSLFQRRNERSTRALVDQSLKLNGSRLTINADWINDAVLISQHLVRHPSIIALHPCHGLKRLDAYQSYLIRELLPNDASHFSREQLLKEAKEEYHRQRLSMLRCLYLVMDKALHMGAKNELQNLQMSVEEMDSGERFNTDDLTLAIEQLEESDLFENLEHELLRQLRAMLATNSQSLQPATCGERELHLLVDILMIRMRLSNCSREYLRDLCTTVKSISADGDVSQMLYAKLTLLLMLSYGFWSLLKISCADEHPLFSEYNELDRSFRIWAMEDADPQQQNALVHYSWHLFRRVFAALPGGNVNQNAAEEAVGAIDVQGVPSILRAMFLVIKNASGAHLCRECLMMLMDACLMTPNFLQDQNQCLQTLEVIRDICYHDLYVSRAIFGSPVHSAIHDLLIKMLNWFSLNPQPLTVLFPAFCFAEFDTTLAYFLSKDFGVVVLHCREDFPHLIHGPGTGEVQARDYFYPRHYRQMPIVKNAVGRVHIRDPLEWAWLGADGANVSIKWNMHSFGTLLFFVFKCCIMELKSGEEARRQYNAIQGHHLLSLVVGLMENCPSLELRTLPFEEFQTSKHVMQLIAFRTDQHQDIREELLFLKHLCRRNPLHVLQALIQAHILTTDADISCYVGRVLSLPDYIPLHQSLSLVSGILVLLTEMVQQRVVLANLLNIVYLISRELVPKLKEYLSSPYQAALVEVYTQVSRFLLAILFLGHESFFSVLGLKREFCEHFCLEDLVKGIVRLLPEHATQCSTEQKKLIITVCQLLSEILDSKLPVHPELVTKVLQFLMSRGYWDTQTPAARLTYFVATAFISDGQQRLDSNCSVACFELLESLLTQFSSYRNALKNIHFSAALPGHGTTLDHDFREALMLAPQYRGRSFDLSQFHAAINLLNKSCIHDSGFYSLLTSQTALVPSAGEATPGLTDILWRFLYNQEEMFRLQPEGLCTVLRSMLSIQRSKHVEGKQTWEQLRGQEGLFKNLFGVVLQPWTDPDTTTGQDPLKTVRDVHEYCESLAMEIISNELQRDTVADVLSEALTNAELLDEKWSDWQRLLDRATECNDVQRENHIVLVANHLVYEIVSALPAETNNDQRSTCLLWTDALRQMVMSILDSRGVGLQEVLAYTKTTSHAFSSGIQRQNVFLYPVPPFEFLVSDLRPAYIFINYLIQNLPEWNRGTVDLLSAAEGTVRLRILPGYIKERCATYTLFEDLLEARLRKQARLASIRAHAVTSWMRITRSAFNRVDADDEKLKEALSLVGDRCSLWISDCVNRIASLRFPEMSLGDDGNFNLAKDGIFRSINLAAALAETVTELANLIPLITNPVEAQHTSVSSPPVRTVSQSSVICDLEPDLSLLPCPTLSSSLTQWFSILPECCQNPELSIFLEGIAETTMHFILLSGHIAPAVIAGEGGEQSFATILKGLTHAANPRILSFKVANAALAALVRMSEAIDEWESDWVIEFHNGLKMNELLQVAGHHATRLVKNSNNPSTDEDIRLWSRNLFRFGISLLKQPQLRTALLQNNVLASLQLYPGLLFRKEVANLGCSDEQSFTTLHMATAESLNGHSQAVEFNRDVNLRKAYQANGTPNLAHQQWCLALKFIGEIIWHTPENLSSSAMQLFDATARILFRSFHHYLGRDFGKYYEPLTLERLKRIEASLEFLLCTHDYFNGSASMLSEYPKRTKEICDFIQRCDRIVRRRGMDFVSPPVSPDENRMLNELVKFNSDLGWFQVCKVGSRRGYFPEDDISTDEHLITEQAASSSEEQMNCYCWKMATGMYRCIYLALEYLRKSVHWTKKFRTNEAEQSSPKETMMRLQTEVIGIGTTLTHADLTEQPPKMRSEMQQFVKTLFKIISLTENFVNDYGLNRRRQQQELFNSQMYTMHQLLSENRTN